MTPTPRVTPICDAQDLDKLLKDYKVMSKNKYKELENEMLNALRGYWPEMSRLKTKKGA